MKIVCRRGSRTPRFAALVLSCVLAGACADGSSTVPPPGPPPPQPPPPPPPPPPGARFAIEYSTYLGGSGLEELREPVLMENGHLLLTARTKSMDLPTTSGAFQRSYGGGISDTYLSIIDFQNERLVAATYFGGSGMERPAYGMGIARDGDLVFTSGTSSPDIPGTAGSYRPNLHSPVPGPGGGYVCRISGDLTLLRWCTYTGGGWPRGGLVLDDQDNILVAGRVAGANYATTPGVVQTQARGTDDAFLLKLDPQGTTAVFSTRLGGTGARGGEVAWSARIAANGSISVFGTSTSLDFPTTPGAAQSSSTGPKDAFVARLSGDATQFEYVTLLGGSGQELAERPHLVLPDGATVSVGWTSSTDLFGASGGAGDTSNGFIARLSPSGTAFDWVRYLGGSADDLLFGPVQDNAGNLLVFGNTASMDIPVTEDALQARYGGGSKDGLIMVLSPDASTVLYATYLGGSGEELIRGAVFDAQGNVYLVGHTTSDDFPITPGAIQPTRAGDQDGFVMKLRSPAP